MSDNFDLIKRYPWLPSLKKYSDLASKAEENPIKYIKEICQSPTFKDMRSQIISIFNDAFDNREYLSEKIDEEFSINIYLFIRILLYILNNKPISNRLANLYSKTIYNELNEEKDYRLYNIYRDLELDVKYEEESVVYKKRILKSQHEIISTNLKINFIDYLRLSSNLKDANRKLINNALKEGYVYLQPKNLNRLIQEYVRIKVITQKNSDPTEINKFKTTLLEIQEFKDVFDILNAKWEIKKEEFEYHVDIKLKGEENLSEILPPCIKEIFAKAKEGQNLIHTERLFIVWFLNALEYPEESIVNIFSTLPDFNREKTSYQVKYARKKKYTPYSCKTLKSNNLCMAARYKDFLCLNGYGSKKLDEKKQISHPLFYVQYKQFIESIKKSPSKNRNRKEDE